MDFLKEILGEEIFNQVKTAIEQYNGNEDNKDRQIKLANLATGDYVGKGKYDALQAALSGKETELTSANDLISQLKKGTKGNEELQGKISEYETENQKLQEQLQETKLKSAIKVALLSEKAVDVDYLTFKLNERLKDKNETLELDENENIKGWSDKLQGLKTQFPNMFESKGEGGEGGYKLLETNRLPAGGEGGSGMTKKELLGKSYAERVEIYNSNPEAYKAAMNSN